MKIDQRKNIAGGFGEMHKQSALFYLFPQGLGLNRISIFNYFFHKNKLSGELDIIFRNCIGDRITNLQYSVDSSWAVLSPSIPDNSASVEIILKVSKTCGFHIWEPWFITFSMRHIF